MIFLSSYDKINILARYKFITVQKHSEITNKIRIMNVSVFTFTHQMRYFRFVDEATRSTGRDVEMALQWEIKTALVLALLIRTGVVLYGEWQDRNSIVKFTDVDYNVFTDAAEYMTQVI